MPRTASEGPANHAEVSQLVAGGMKKSEAFVTVASAALGTGASEEDIAKKARSIATNYYRIEREGNGTAAPAKPRAAKPKTVAASNGTVTGDALGTLTQAINEVKALQSELATLRQFKAKVDALTS